MENNNSNKVDYDIDELMNKNSNKLKNNKKSNRKIDKKKISENKFNSSYDKNEEDFITMIKRKKEANTPSSKFFYLFLSLIFTGMILMSLAYIIYTIFKFDEISNQIQMIINSCILFFMCLCIITMYLSKKKRTKRFLTVTSTLTLCVFFIFNFLVDFNFIKIPVNEVLRDFTDVPISEAIKWAEKHNIDVIQNYDNSDQIERYHIITQDVKPNTLVRNIDTISFVVSDGPDYTKEVSLENMVGWHIDDAMEVIEANFLNNVIIDYELNNEVKKDIILKQNKDGQVRRNEEVIIVVSLGDGSDLKPVKIKDFHNKELLKTILWLKSHGILYEINYEFSNTVDKDVIIKQSIEKGNVVTPNKDKVILTVSKGKQVIVPNFANMTISEITNWISANKLKVQFEEKYNSFTPKGKIVESNYKTNDPIEENATVHIVISKGALLMKKFSSLNEFRNWAQEHNIVFEEVYEENNSVKKGNIIRFSVDEGMPVNTGDVIVVYISNGGRITIPNFVGQTKSSITNTCKNLGLNCTFSYGGKTSYDKDIAISQNKKANSKVIEGTYVNIVLSEGKSSNIIGCTEIERKIFIPDEWLSNSGEETKQILEKNLKGAYPKIEFTIEIQDNSETSGKISEKSEVRNGSIVYDCRKYKIIINK